MIIRKAVATDASSIKKLLIQLGYPGLSVEETHKKISDYNEDTYCVLVSEVDNEVVGFISLHWFDLFHSPGKMGRISAFCVDDKLRSQGIGQKLLQASEEFLISAGCTKIEVTSNERRVRTHQFYPKVGYIEDSRRFVKYPGKE
jgi:GNAT superfamily N-acetyltransferase